MFYGVLITPLRWCMLCNFRGVFLIKFLTSWPFFVCFVSLGNFLLLFYDIFIFLLSLSFVIFIFLINLVPYCFYTFGFLCQSVKDLKYNESDNFFRCNTRHFNSILTRITNGKTFSEIPLIFRKHAVWTSLFLGIQPNYACCNESTFHSTSFITFTSR